MNRNAKLIAATATALLAIVVIIAIAFAGSSITARPRIATITKHINYVVYRGRATTVPIRLSYPQFQSPQVVGVAQQGDSLTTSNGTWTNTPTSFSYQWEDCNTQGASCTDATGANNFCQNSGTGCIYTLTGADVGSTMIVIVTASNSQGASAPAHSAPTAVIAAPNAPGNITPPTILGTAAVTNTLTETGDTWTNNPTSFSYQWEDCNSSGGACQPIVTNGNNATYVVQESDVGYSLKVAVTASNPGGNVTATSLPTNVVQSDAGSTIFGTQSVGTGNNALNQDLLSVNSATPSVSGTVTQLDIYLLPTNNGVVGTQNIRGVIYDSTGSGGNPGSLLGTSEQLTFSNTQAAGWYTLQFDTPVSVTGGTPVWIGVATSATSGIVLDATATVTNSRRIASTPFTYPNIPATFGATTTDNLNVSIYAIETQAAIGSPVNTALPAVTDTTSAGRFQQGDVLTTTDGTWTIDGTPTTCGSSGSYSMTCSYEWQDCNSSGANCTAIAGATTNTYTLTLGDVGSTIRSVVTATNSAGAPSASSTASIVVTGLGAPPVNTVLPTITGVPYTGNTLTSSQATWTVSGVTTPCNSSGMTCAYQWQLCSPSCANIVGATASTYVIPTADVGDTIDVVVTATNSTGSTPATSAQTATITTASSGAVVPATPDVPTSANPAGGWSVEYGDAFGEPLYTGTGSSSGTDNTLIPLSYPQQSPLCTGTNGSSSYAGTSPPSNPNEVEVFQCNQAQTCPSAGTGLCGTGSGALQGLVLTCQLGTTQPTGTYDSADQHYLCGSVATRGSEVSGYKEFKWNVCDNCTYAFQAVVQMSPNTGEADDSWWSPSDSGSTEIDFFEEFGHESCSEANPPNGVCPTADYAPGWCSTATSGTCPSGGNYIGGALPGVVGNALVEDYLWRDLGHDPAAAFHTYTTVIAFNASGAAVIKEYVDATQVSWSYISSGSSEVTGGNTLTVPAGDINADARGIMLDYPMRDQQDCPSHGTQSGNDGCDPDLHFTSGTRHMVVQSVAVYENATAGNAGTTNPGIAPGSTVG